MTSHGAQHLLGSLTELQCRSAHRRGNQPERGLETNPALELGVCGEHGSDPTSIEFFDRVGLDYVSCSPTRIPVARLSAAQAALARQEVVG